VRRSLRLVVSAALMLGVTWMPSPAMAQPDLHSPNMQLLDNEPGVPNPAVPGSVFVNSDLAFWGNRLYAGNFGGFRIFDITNGANPALIEDFSCPGSQFDISVWNNDADPEADLLFAAVDSVRTDPSCASAGAPGGGLNYAPGWEGVRIIDINDETNPVQIAAVPTDCGAHTLTVAPTDEGVGAPAANTPLYVYVSSYPLSGQTNDIPADTTQDPDRVVGTRDNGTQCVEPEPGTLIPNLGHNKISIIEVNLSDPAAADDFVPGMGGVGKVYPAVTEFGLPLGTRMTHINLGPRHLEFTACHDISVFMELNLMAGSCWDEGILWDITDPGAPDFLRRIRLDAVDLIFHSVTFSWDGEVVVWEDEAGGGTDDRCRSSGDQQGRMWFTDTDLNVQGSFKIPRTQQPVGGDPQICTAHLYNYVPQTDDRDILVSAWYEGGTSVADATNTGGVTEIGFYDAQANPAASDVWASYWYNGFIYVNDIVRGLDTMAFNDARVENAVELPFFNPQTMMNTIAQQRPTCKGREATLWGTSQADALTATNGPDVLVGLGGKDAITALGGNDIVCAGGGNDKVKGNRGKDKLNGEAGKDNLNGGPQRDRCNGGPGKDKAKACEKEKSIP
jgi:RTX calcium-binding nonapeptide repeat (4 copies)